ncbi:MAG: hypothetical protein GW815_00755 [Candidatus Moranbacteria bacterium]|nr:hypothetical protein [Candidatus Moranbacteria bacterium]OIQ04411.1 MAG: hypothetical protein AUK58_00575 [Candidatus Moranbacteria bacterium CG2_30_41_165]PIP25220.1 MAG: hypothetical protein COX32_04725 [Candidatus Moranbacteria bacterium CG23_combo_of_CG06-09_8_20_14_all_41_28]PIV85976.1 MAG: hypothetical protein COW50_04020 [Candidatus Moranbacteria bacterium CG17_big_fil_post_rev_8_21_14_2_50_41_107]PIX91667.1 MAG: hypothetical protein COZ27_01580 [Candidatus Moranbacteria bacterium CG_
MISRQTKQFLIFFTYFLLAVLFGIIIYYGFIKDPETCFDGKQNQNETGLDCGGVCALVCKEVVTGELLQMKEEHFIPSGKDTYDIVAKVFNPNGEAGAVSFSYTAVLKDASQTVLASRTGTGYILPLENKYILEFNLQSSTMPASVSVLTDNIEWAHFSGYQEKPAVNIYQKRYNEVTSSAVFGEAVGLVSNESQYDFRSVVIQVILRDRNNMPLAINSTVMNTLRSNENRDFRLVWPTAFPGTVENVEMIVDADVYHSENFIKQYISGTVAPVSVGRR